MRLLITTQAVDRNDPILGFFHGWLLEFAKHFEEIHVICLKAGDFNLPKNVTVHSLGKEVGESRLKYVIRFYKYVFLLRRDIDIVFSHMNPHYIVLAGWIWLIMRKPMYLWRNHAQMNLKTWIAAQYSRNVFYTSPFACTQRFSHSVQMPVGIDTATFAAPQESKRIPRSVLFLGRLSKVKQPVLFMKAAAQLKNCVVSVYGDVSPDQGLSIELLESYAQGRVNFHHAVLNSETPVIYGTHEVYVNLTPEGSMDKTVLEAAACGALVLVANRSFQRSFPPECMINDLTPAGIANAIEKMLSLPSNHKLELQTTLRKVVDHEHSLSLLAARLTGIFRGHE